MFASFLDETYRIVIYLPHNMIENEISTVIQKLSALTSHLNTQHVVLLSIENIKYVGCR